MARISFTSTRILFAAVAIATTVSVSGCATASARSDREGTLRMAPKWFLNLPDDKKAYLATGIGESPLMGLAVDIASAAARAELARNIGVTVDARYQSVANQNKQATSDQTVQDAIEKVNAEIKNQTAKQLEGSRIRERKIATGNGGYVAWVLVELPRSTISDAATSAIRALMNQTVDERVKKALSDLDSAYRVP